jgi:hypothetical protein
MIKRIVILLAFIGLIAPVYAGVTVGSDVYFNTSFYNDVSNYINTTGYNTWIGRDTVLAVGLYPILKSDYIKGTAKICVNSETYNNIYFGGANVTGMTKEKNVTATVFALSPAFAMSDPMATGVSYGSDATSTPIASQIHFYNRKNIYPLLYDVSWMYESDYYLGGDRGVGGYSKIIFANGLLQLEDFACYNLNNYDSYAGMLKLNPLDLSFVTISAGATAETIKFKESENFSVYNSYYIFDMIKQMPEQTTMMKEDAYLAYGGYIDANIMKMVTVFAQAKLVSLRGLLINR